MHNITIGQYIPGNSWLHKMDPRLKIMSLLLMLVAVFLVPISAEFYLIGAMIGFLLLTLLLIVSTKIPLKKVLSGLKAIMFLLTFTFIVQIFYIQTGTPLTSPLTFYVSVTSIFAVILWLTFYHFTKRFVKMRVVYFLLSLFMFFFLQYQLPYVPLFDYQVIIYDESLLRALFIFLRITTVIMLTSLLTFTTMTTDLNYGLESLMKPLKVIKVPVDVIAMMISLTLRYIPTLLMETEKIMKAQASRGVDFKESNFKEKVTQIISLLIPVFVISFKRAEDLANAMEVRGYVIGAPRTRMDEFHIRAKDWVAFFGSFLLLMIFIYMVFFV
jgi:energy-coupling factor transport system permease protein